jgi:hypothetical protein
MIVTATLPDGTQRQIEALVEYPTTLWASPAAFLTGGTLSMKGSFSVLGAKGLVHSNEDIVGNGGANAIVAVSVNAAGSTSGFSMVNPPPGGLKDGSSNPQVTTVPIPQVDPEEYRHDPALVARMIVLTPFGTMTDGFGSSLPQAPDLPFTYSSGTWSISGSNSVRPAIYYVEGNFSMTGQGSSSPYNMSIIATSSVKLAGNSKFHAFTDPYTGISNNTLIMAGGDITLTGTGQASDPLAQYKGSVFAREQILIKGNYRMEGAAVGENRFDQSSLVSTSSSVEDVLQGNATIVYNGEGTFVRNPQSAVNIVNVRRLK